jgi:hypothetical protein
MAYKIIIFTTLMVVMVPVISSGAETHTQSKTFGKLVLGIGYFVSVTGSIGLTVANSILVKSDNPNYRSGVAGVMCGITAITITALSYSQDYWSPDYEPQVLVITGAFSVLSIGLGSWVMHSSGGRSDSSQDTSWNLSPTVITNGSEVSSGLELSVRF